MKTLLTLVAMASLIAACAPKEKTITVNEFMPDRALTKKVNAWCGENWGERGGLPNCINASAAMARVMSICQNTHADGTYCPKD